MPELLVELGCEELPAIAVQRAYEDLRDSLAKAIDEAGLAAGGVPVAMGTPRRLIVCFATVKDRQEDVVKEQRGPALKSAYDDQGNPTPALLGFCRSSGVEPEGLRRDDQYVWADRKIPGKPATEVLSELVPKAIRGLTFDKTMRWGGSRMRFARPIRWIVALLDAAVIPFDIEGVVAGKFSRGHRFYARDEFAVSGFETLIKELRGRKVEPEPSLRRESILSAAGLVEGGTADLPESLVDENVFLTEWPAVVEGVFREEYLALPEPVLVTAMAKHEKMFPIRDVSGRLTNRFLFVRNAGEDAAVRKGAEWVLNARFNDAKFFHDEDRRYSLDEFLAKTSTILFSEKLGTVRQRADRLAELAEIIAKETGGDKDEQVLARSAGLYAKADLSSGLVSELASLQGIIGGEYARREGMLDEIGWAIRSQYDPSLNRVINKAAARTAVRLLIADQLDKLAGYLGVGLVPSGSSDPFGLRRAATQLIEAAWDWPTQLPSYSELLQYAIQNYSKQGIELAASEAEYAMSDLFASRYASLLPNVRYDLLEAAMLTDFPVEILSPQRVKLRTIMLEAFADSIGFIQTATRPINIVAAAKKKGIPFSQDKALEELDLAALDSTDGASLYTTLKKQDDAIAAAVAKGDGLVVVKMVKNLADPITRFFESTMVMAEQEDVRFARLSLMQATTKQLFAVGDFSKIVMEGQ